MKTKSVGQLSGLTPKRYAALIALLSIGLILTGSEVENDVLFFVVKLLGFIALWCFKRLYDRWEPESEQNY